MARYRWVIRTKESWGAGTDAGVFLGLTGDKQRMAETELDDPDSFNDWEAGDINHGLIETEELGNLVSGTLRHNGKGAGSNWAVDYVRVWNDEDGRSWLAHVDKTLSGQAAIPLKFKQEAGIGTSPSRPRGIAASKLPAVKDRGAGGRDTTQLRYRWLIETAFAPDAGTDANVYLSLRGSKGRTPEFQLRDSGSRDNFEKGDTNSGFFSSPDLGELETGTLRHDNSGIGPSWAPLFIRITEEAGDREWTAIVPMDADHGGQFPLLSFRRTSSTLPGQITLASARRSHERAVEYQRRVAIEAVADRQGGPRPGESDEEFEARRAIELPFTPPLQPARSAKPAADAVVPSGDAHALAEPPSQKQLPITKGTPRASAEGTPIVGKAGEFGASFEPFRVMEPAEQSPAEQSPAAEAPAEPATNGEAESAPDDGSLSKGESDWVSV